jgi:hypothetical protein
VVGRSPRVFTINGSADTHQTASGNDGRLHTFVVLFSRSDLIRFGVQPMAVATFVVNVLLRSPLTTDVSAWSAKSMFAALAILLAISLWSFKTALGSRKLWAGDFLER